VVEKKVTPDQKGNKVISQICKMQGLCKYGPITLMWGVRYPAAGTHAAISGKSLISVPLDSSSSERFLLALSYVTPNISIVPT
jgi:hypothetical protein